MELLKKSNKYIKATSILESVIALSIISICLYIAMMVLAVVFSPKTSPKFYNSQNKANALFYEMQLNHDSVIEIDSFQIDKEIINSNIDKILVTYKDSAKFKFKKSFYLLKDGE